MYCMKGKVVAGGLKNSTVTKCLIFTGQLMFVGGELEESGREEIRELQWRN